VLDELVVHFLLVRCGAHVAPPIDASGGLHTASTAPTFSSGNRALPRPFILVVLPRALPSVSRTQAIVRTVGTARSSAHSKNLSQSRTLDFVFASAIDYLLVVSYLASRGLVLASAKFCRWRGVPGKTGVVGVGFWRLGKFWRCRCRYRGAVGMQQTAKCELHWQIWRFGVLAWRGGDAPSSCVVVDRAK
jgi:hypothetical protein